MGRSLFINWLALMENSASHCNVTYLDIKRLRAFHKLYGESRIKSAGHCGKGFSFSVILKCSGHEQARV